MLMTPMTTTDPSPKPAASNASADTLDISKSYGLIFGTPLTVYVWPESDAVNAELRELILSKEATSEGLSRSNVGGWHSTPDFFAWDAECVRVVEDRVKRLFIATSHATAPDRKGVHLADCWIEGWANINRDGSYNTLHNHSTAIWSGVYYVTTGEPEGDNRLSGVLEIIDPCYALKVTDLYGKIINRQCLVRPQPGIMAIFPSWLAHQVHPFRGKNERISISFNVYMPQGIEPHWVS